MSTKNKIAQNYRTAERLRKERERAELLEAEEKLKEQMRAATHRAQRAEQSERDLRRNARVLDKSAMEHIVAHMVTKMVREMGTEPYAEVVQEFLRRSLIRIDRYRMPMGVEVIMDNDLVSGEPTVTVTIPEFRLTQILDDGFLEIATGGRGRGPVVMEDRPIHVYTEPNYASPQYIDPNTPVSMKTETI